MNYSYYRISYLKYDYIKCIILTNCLIEVASMSVHHMFVGIKDTNALGRGRYLTYQFNTLSGYLLCSG